MRPYFSSRGLLPILLASLLLSGCAENFRADSTLFSDGAVERTIYQPRQSTPDDIRRSQSWSHRSTGRPLEGERWRTDPLDRLSPPSEGEGEYFVASGRFTSAKQLPVHFRDPGAHPTRAAELQRQVSRNDWGLVTEHIWQETLTDVVTLSEMRQARHELGTQVVEDAVEVLSLTLGPDYDVTRLREWAQTEGLAWYEQLVDALYQVSAHHQDENQRTALLAAEFTEISSHYGLILRDASGRWLHEMPGSSDELEQIVRRFASAKLQELVRNKDGTPIAEDTVEEVFQQIKALQDDERTSQLEDVAKQVILRKYGSEDAYQKQMLQLASQVLGVHMLRIGQRDFQFTMQVPGQVVETNGTLLSENKVQWRFKHHQAFPFGYVMHCRSLEPQLDIQQRLLQGQPLQGRQTMLRFVTLLQSDGRLHDAMSQSIRQGNLLPLQELQQTMQGEQPSQSREDLAELLRLFQVP
jgi:hypothetical protein